MISKKYWLSPLAGIRVRPHVSAAAAVTALLIPGTGSAMAATAPAPIEGTWNLQGGQVAVQQTGTNTFQGTVVQPTTFSSCSHPVGQVIWQINGSGMSYTGTHVWFKSGCQPNPGGQTTWNIVNTSPAQYTMNFCTASPGSGPPNPSATPSNPVGSTQCYALTRNLAPGQVGPPSMLTAPSISGTPKAGNALTCSPGSWTGGPTGYAYEWNRNGTPIVGATSQTHVVSNGDEGLTLTCVVTAFNFGGGSSPATSNGVFVPVTSVAGCPAATGRLSGQTLGLAKLGMTPTQARHAFAKSSDKRGKLTDLFCLTPSGIRVGYASSKLVSTLSSSDQKLTTGRVVVAVTANAFYAVHGIRAGSTLSAANRKLKLSSAFRRGANSWYTASNGSSTALIEVRRSIVQEVGIADKRLTNGRAAQSRLIKSFF